MIIDRFKRHRQEYKAEVADPDPVNLRESEVKYYGRQLTWQMGSAVSMLAGAYALFKTGNPEGLEVVPVAATTVSFIGSCVLYEINARRHDAFLLLEEQTPGSLAPRDYRRNPQIEELQAHDWAQDEQTGLS